MALAAFDSHTANSLGAVWHQAVIVCPSLILAKLPCLLACVVWLPHVYVLTFFKLLSAARTS